ncbi:MAG TPA: S1C family serine protease [Xanthobacteraceae bacterium]|nr:S1C family serine protease [Xanthobacteraceae bacterium]
MHTIRLTLALLLGFAASALATAPVRADSVEALIESVVRIKTFINPDGQTVQALGREREGSGIVIDEDGLVLTIGYLMVEAHAAEVITNEGRTLAATVVGYDPETGFGILRTLAPMKVKPLAFGRSTDVKAGDPVLIASGGGLDNVRPARVTAKREFAGSWEYLLDEAIFTSPPHPAWSGAALISREGKLIGVGSLIVGDARGDGSGTPGNMFVPIEKLPPILGDLIADGRVSGAGHPWLGVAADDVRGHLMVGRVTPGGPADKAGIRKGDEIVGVGGETPRGLADFYRKVWAAGPAGTTVPLDVDQDGRTRRIDVPSINRLDNLKLKSTL